MMSIVCLGDSIIRTFKAPQVTCVHLMNSSFLLNKNPTCFQEHTFLLPHLIFSIILFLAPQVTDISKQPNQRTQTPNMSWLRSKKEPAASIVSAKSSSSSMPPMYTPIGRNSQGLDKYTLAGDTMPDPLTKYEPKKEGDNSASGAPDAPQEIAPQSVYGDVDKFKHLLPDETKPYNGTITRISSGSIMSKIPNFANSTSINKSVKSIQLNSYGTPVPADVKKTSGLPVPNPYDSAKPTEKQNSSGSMGSNPFGSANPRDRRNSSGYRGPFGPPRSTGIRNPPGSLIPRPFSSIRDHVSIGSGPFNHGKPTDRRGASVSAKPPMQGPKVIIIPKPSSANPLAEKKESAFDSRRGCPSGFGWLKIPGGYSKHKAFLSPPSHFTNVILNLNNPVSFQNSTFLTLCHGI